jgi:ABC-2 type transport system ATP-binding protein
MQRGAEGAAFAVSIDGLRKDYGDIKAVDGLTLAIPEAEVFGLLGPNGSGKTTTINCMTGSSSRPRGRSGFWGSTLGRREPKSGR